MSPAALASVREAAALATMTPGEAVAADCYEEHLAAVKAAPEREQALLLHVRELECKLEFIQRQAATHIDLAHRLAKDKRTLLGLLDVETERVDANLFRAAQARIRNQRNELARLEREKAEAWGVNKRCPSCNGRGGAHRFQCPEVGGDGLTLGMVMR